MQAVENKEVKEEKIEITAQMILEGVWAANLHWPETEGYEELVKDVYVAMESTRHRS